jgi:hypothetical protein
MATLLSGRSGRTPGVGVGAGAERGLMGTGFVTQKPSFSSLRLQMALYFNCLFSVFFAIIIGACSVTKVCV